MKNQKLYPIGYLLKILHVSYTDIANALYLDRTVVNKWALGKRTFNSNSKHYSRVVNYLIQINEAKDENILEKLFDKIYPATTLKNEEYLRDCIHKFLDEPDIFCNTGGSIINTTENVIYCSVPVYKTTSGRFAALMALLNETISSDKKQEIFIYDSEQFNWLTEDNYYNVAFKNSMVNVLKNGHKVTFISEVDYLKRYYVFGSLMETFYPYTNFCEYYFASGETPHMIYSYYLLKGERVVLGNQLSTGELYTIALSDPYSVDSCEARLSHHLNRCVLHKCICNDRDRFQLINLIKVIGRTNDVSFIYAVGLSFVTMDSKLLSDVLQSNKIYGEKREQILDLNRNHQIFVYNKSALNPALRHVCYYDDVESMLTSEMWYLEALSLHIGKKIYLDRKQVIRHILATAELLEQSEIFSLGFLRDSETGYRSTHGILCRRNQYCISCHGQLRITREVSIVNATIDLMKNEWSQNIPSEYKDNHIVAKRLRELVDKYDNR